jgi:hypothetical protein
MTRPQYPLAMHSILRTCMRTAQAAAAYSDEPPTSACVRQVPLISCNRQPCACGRRLDFLWRERSAENLGSTGVSCLLLCEPKASPLQLTGSSGSTGLELGSNAVAGPALCCPRRGPRGVHHQARMMAATRQRQKQSTSAAASPPFVPDRPGHSYTMFAAAHPFPTGPWAVGAYPTGVGAAAEHAPHVEHTEKDSGHNNGVSAYSGGCAGCARGRC